VATLFIKCRKTKTPPDASAIIAAFAAHGIKLIARQVRVPHFYDGTNKAKPRNFALVEAIDDALAAAALALVSMDFEGATFLISEARQRIPARFTAQEASPAMQPRAARATAIQPKNERFKPFTEDDFRR
jgi:hypothetical protein